MDLRQKTLFMHIANKATKGAKPQKKGWRLGFKYWAGFTDPMWLVGSENKHKRILENEMEV